MINRRASTRLTGMGFVDSIAKIVRPLFAPLQGTVTERSNRFWASQSRTWPVTIDIEDDVRIIWANTPPWIAFGAFIPDLDDPKELNPPYGSALDLYHWAISELNAAPSGFSTVRLDVREKSNVEVIFDSVRVHCEEYDPGPGISIIQPVGGASLESRRFDIELSAWGPRAQALDLGSSPIKEFAATINRNDPLRINLDAHPADYITQAKAFRWWLDVDFLIEGTRKSIRVPKNPEDRFRLVNSSHFPMYHRVGDTWELVPKD